MYRKTQDFGCISREKEVPLVNSKPQQSANKPHCIRSRAHFLGYPSHQDRGEGARVGSVFPGEPVVSAVMGELQLQKQRNEQKLHFGAGILSKAP